MKKDSSPGYPWGLCYADKAAVLEQAGMEVYDMVNHRLRSYLNLSFDFDGGVEAAVDYVEGGFVDPIRLFIKNEPHTIEKVAQNRYRLVSSVSIVDELIERLLGGPQNETEIDHWLYCPSKPGIGLSNDEQTTQFYEVMKPWIKKGTLKKSDVSGWDMNFKGWMYKADYYRRLSMASGEFHAQWGKMLKGRFVCLSRSLLITSDGVVYAQTIDCLMKSGSYFTSSTNSAARVILATLLGADYAVAMGDDCVESNERETLPSLYEQMGFRIKGLELCTSSFEFCSHEFYPDRAVPLNFWKGVFRLLSREPDEFEYIQFKYEYRHVDSALMGPVLSLLDTLPGWCGVKTTEERE